MKTLKKKKLNHKQKGKTPSSFSVLLAYSFALCCGSNYSSSKLNRNIKSMKIFLAVSLNPIKQFDLENCQPNSLSISSFKLNRMGADPK